MLFLIDCLWFFSFCFVQWFLFFADNVLHFISILSYFLSNSYIWFNGSLMVTSVCQRKNSEFLHHRSYHFLVFSGKAIFLFSRVLVLIRLINTITERIMSSVIIFSVIYNSTCGFIIKNGVFSPIFTEM